MTVTAAQGSLASGVAAGIKESGDPGPALVVNQGPSRAAAGVFTSSRVQAAQVRWSGKALSNGTLFGGALRRAGLRAGEDRAAIRTNDLTTEYVHENSTYSS